MSYAIVNVAGEQCKVTAEEVVRVPRLDAEIGKKLSFKEVLLISDGEKVTVGAPFVEGKTVEAEVVRHGRDRKIVVFKKKRRKNYRRTRGHRQQFTEIRISALPK